MKSFCTFISVFIFIKYSACRMIYCCRQWPFYGVVVAVMRPLFEMMLDDLKPGLGSSAMFIIRQVAYKIQQINSHKDASGR